MREEFDVVVALNEDGKERKESGGSEEVGNIYKRVLSLREATDLRCLAPDPATFLIVHLIF